MSEPRERLYICDYDQDRPHYWSNERGSFRTTRTLTAMLRGTRPIKRCAKHKHVPNTVRRAHVLDRIMKTAHGLALPVTVRATRDFGGIVDAWSVTGLRNILARRGYKLHVRFVGMHRAVLIADVIRPALSRRSA